MGETDDPVELTQGAYNMLILDLKDARADLAATRAELATMREALEWYAEGDTHRACDGDGGTIIWPIYDDKGERARAALAHGAGEQRAAAVPASAGRACESVSPATGVPCALGHGHPGQIGCYHESADRGEVWGVLRR